MSRLNLAGIILCLCPAALLADEIDRSAFPDELRALEWREVGPYRGGRSAAVTGIPDDRGTFWHAEGYALPR